MITKDTLHTFNDTHRTLVKTEGFVYLFPHPELLPRISNYTITFPHECIMSDEYAVIPHGCATLVLSSSDKGTSINLFGPATKPVSIGAAANRSKLLFIVEFQPAGYYAFSGIPQKELTDCVLPFEIVNPALNQLLIQQIEKSRDIHSLIAEIDRLFLTHLKIDSFRAEFSLANDIIVKNGGVVSVKALSNNTYFSERHLSRIFTEYMGVNIKSFSRLVRVNKAIRLLRNPRYSITMACFQTGYYDIPHFIHDFKLICGITPQEYRNNLSDFYSEIAKF